MYASASAVAWGRSISPTMETSMGARAMSASSHFCAASIASASISSCSSGRMRGSVLGNNVSATASPITPAGWLFRALIDCAAVCFHWSHATLSIFGSVSSMYASCIPVSRSAGAPLMVSERASRPAPPKTRMSFPSSRSRMFSLVRDFVAGRDHASIAPWVSPRVWAVSSICPPARVIVTVTTFLR